jgi:hypothetical protein
MFVRSPKALMAACCALGALAASPAHAALVFNLDKISGTTIAPLNTSVGTVTLTQNGADEVDVLVTLLPGTSTTHAVELINSGGPHTPFVFSLKPAKSGATVSVISPSPTFYALSGTQSDTPYGSFTNGIGYTGQNGGGHGNAGPLSFSVTDAAGISVSDFTRNASGYYFAADVIGPSGGTGSVSAVPLPGAVTMFGAAFMGLVGFAARKKAVLSAWSWGGTALVPVC